MVQRRSRLKDRLNGEMAQQIGALGMCLEGRP